MKILTMMDNCPKCMQLKLFCKSKGIKYDLIQANSSESNEIVKKYNVRSAPFVVMDDGTGMTYEEFMQAQNQTK